MAKNLSNKEAGKRIEASIDTTDANLDVTKSYLDLEKRELETLKLRQKVKIKYLNDTDFTKISSTMREKNILPSSWDYTSEEGLQRIKVDFFEAGMGTGLAVYSAMFTELSKSFNIPGGASKEDAKFYATPLAYIDNNGELKKPFENFKDTGFVNAVREFNSLRNSFSLVANVNSAVPESRQSLNKAAFDPILENVSNFIANTKDDIRRGDWASLAPKIAIGGIAFIALKSVFFSSGKGTSYISKIFKWGAVGLGVKLLLDNYAPDFSRKDGDTISNKFIRPVASVGADSVLGTETQKWVNKDSRESLPAPVLDVLSNKDRPVDYNTLIRSSLLNVRDLYFQTLKRGSVPNFIDPNLFPEFLKSKPDFAGLTPSDLSGGGKLSSMEKRYRDAGTSLYNIVRNAKDNYNTLIKPKNEGLSFDKFLENHPDADIVDIASAFKTELYLKEKINSIKSNVKNLRHNANILARRINKTKTDLKNNKSKSLENKLNGLEKKYALVKKKYSRLNVDLNKFDKTVSI